MEHRFNCVSCGQCCYGSIPLTLEDAWRHAGRFPLALVWTAVPQRARAFSLATRIGVEMKAGKGGRIAALIVPTAYIPPLQACPELKTDGLCNIHENKPLRCRTMPFYPYREESDQADLLRPRQGWACDTSMAAAVVYRDRKLVERGDFDREREELLQQAPVIRQYAAYMLKYSPWIVEHLAMQAARPGGNVITSLSSFLTATRHPQASVIARQQAPVLHAFAGQTAEQAEWLEYHRNYAGWAKEMDYLAA